MAQLSSGIKNWHWRTKGVEGWAKEWFASNLTGVEADGVAVEEVTDVEGDCELGMRKSKLVTVYDQRVSMRWAATSKDGEAITGTLIALEVMHDMDEDEYQFEAALTAGSGAEADAFLRTAKKALANKLRSKFQQFPKDMVSTHGSDLLQDVDTPSASGSSTPAAPPTPSASTSAPSSSSVPAAKASSSPAKLNTATVRASGEFQCDAETLFGFLTDATKIPAWTRNPAQMAPEVGADVSLFGGNIRGKVDKVERPKGFTMSWRAPTWPEGHFGSLETSLDQGSNSTTLSLKLSGVPIGKEDEAENNLHVFYIRGLQSIGLGLLSSSSTSTAPSSSSRTSTKRTKRAAKPPSSVLNRWTLVNVGSFAASIGLLAAFGAALYYGPNGVGAAKK
ncbi:hypothetical protein JCM8208_005907 [Rhodotorula glutinis]